jgi:hypothetical protein
LGENTGTRERRRFKMDIFQKMHMTLELAKKRHGLRGVPDRCDDFPG